MVASEKPSQHHGGMAIFYWESPHFVVEAHHQHGLNVIRLQLVMEELYRLVVG